MRWTAGRRALVGFQACGPCVRLIVVMERARKMSLVGGIPREPVNFWDRWNWLTRVRPAAVSSVLLKLVSPVDRRRILTTSRGLKIYADPFSALGRVLRETSTYEPDVTELFQE